MSEKLNAINEISYSQTLNVTYKTWEMVRKQVVDTKWKKLENIMPFITKRDGIAFAIWRIYRQMDKSGAYTLTKVETKRVKKKDLDYSVFSFTAVRKPTDISAAD